MSYSEKDRQAFYSDIVSIKHNDAIAIKKEKVKKWLQDNPNIGELSSGTYYKIVNDTAVYVEVLTGKELNK